MIALIVPREEAGAAGGLPHLELAAGVGWSAIDLFSIWLSAATEEQID
ncbi:MAG: hypothetical protein ACM65L_06075 [Microcoleus sp.]